MNQPTNRWRLLQVSLSSMENQELIGRRVLLVGNHPHKGRAGVIRALEQFKILNRMGLVIDFDDNTSGAMFDKKEIKFI